MVLEYWYDPNHTWCLRIIDYTKNIIYGSDPNELFWHVTLEVINSNKLKVDFSNKKTHHGKKIMTTEYEDRRMTLHWEDGNKWRRMRNDPTILLKNLIL